MPTSYRTADGLSAGAVGRCPAHDEGLAVRGSEAAAGRLGRLGVGDTRETIETRTKETVGDRVEVVTAITVTRPW